MNKRINQGRILLCLLPVLFLNSCGKKTSPKALEGSYRLSGMERGDLQADEGAESLAFLSSLGDSVVLELSEDGSGSLSILVSDAKQNSAEVRWDQKSLSESGGKSYAWTLEGKELSLKAEDGSVLVFTRTD